MYSKLGGCSSDSSSGDDTVSLTGVTISGTANISATGNTTLTATPAFSGAADESLVTYTWKITSGENYALIYQLENIAYITGNNTTTQSQRATVFVTATYNGVSKSATQTISIAAASSDNPYDPDNPYVPDNPADEPSYDSKITIKYSSSHGTAPSSKSYDKTDSGYTLTSDDLPSLTETGYIFGGWALSSDSTATVQAGETITQDTTLYALWTAITYTVKFDSNGGSGSAISEISATYDEEFDVPENTFTYDGYNASANTWNTSSDGSGTTLIAGNKAKNLTAENGATVTLYAIWVEKGAHSITYLDSDGSAISGMSPVSFKETEDVDLSNATPTKAGYTFAGWAVSADAAAAISSWKSGEKTSDVTLYAIWTANTDTKYTVKHYLQPVSLSATLSDYEEQTSDEENLTGTTGAATSAAAKTYSGFTAQTITQGTIASDGSTVVSVYYDRKEITLTFDSDGGSEVSSISGKYGTAVTAPANPTKSGYGFSTWNPELPETFPAENATYKAIWKETKVTSIVISVPAYSGLDDFITVSESENYGGFPCIIFTAESGFDYYYWSHSSGTSASSDSGGGTTSGANVFALRKSTLEPGSHTVIAIVKKDENYYSATIEFIVEDE